jgi:flavin-dependent dehydrogenase
MEVNRHDMIVVGGGVAGLTLSIQLARKGADVLLLEKNTYPFHRVCGEYVSLEAWDCLRRCGIHPEELHLPRISNLHVTSPSGRVLSHTMNSGGYGISRYLLDDLLSKNAVKAGVKLLTSCKVSRIVKEGEGFVVHVGGIQYRSRLVAASYGKRSNLDLGMGRAHALTKASGTNNYVAVKYHVKYDHDPATISLHNFSHGYCGLSRVENNRSCLCYLTTEDNLRRSGNNIKRLESGILSANPYLRKVLSEADHFYDKPLTISQISFAPRSLIENDVLMLGDASGMISPLCGNGMSMAMQSSSILSNLVSTYLRGDIRREELFTEYHSAWHNAFGVRLTAGRILQPLFGRKILSDVFISMLRPFPKLVSGIVSLTHGKAF